MTPAPTFQPLLDALPYAALVVDAKDRVIATNDAATQLLGWQAQGLLLVNVLRQPDVIATLDAVRGGADQSTARYLSRKSEGRVFDVVARPLGAGQVVLSFVDVTAVEEAGQIRRDFVANVSHELRTPLTALIGFIETLQGPAKGDAKAHERFLGIMLDEATRMTRLVDDLLSLSRVESTERTRPSGLVNLAELMGTLKEYYESQGNDHTIQLDVQTAQTSTVGDVDQLRQVLSNLIENALKYAPDTPVTLRLEGPVYARELRGDALKLTVMDQGPGIDPIHIPRLTERFYRIDTHRSRAMGGTGLGLAIVKHILTRHRGALKIKSALGQGSSFSILLPAI